MSWLRAPLYPLAAVGVAAIALGAMLAVPLKTPPPLASVHDSAAHIDTDGAPALSHVQARDGTWLAYRLYPAQDGSKTRVALLAHGSTGNSIEMNGAAKALAAAGVTAVALDIRGHGASGTRGDVAYVGQLDDDLADVLDALGHSYPQAHFALAGFSLGGGFAARIAGGPLGARFDRLVAISPFLGPRAPTNRPNVGAGRWAEVDMPRILALTLLGGLGVSAGQSLPAIHYATAEGAQMRQTPVYSYRLMASYSPSYDWSATAASIRAAASRFEVLVGAQDQLMDAEAMSRELRPLGAQVAILPGVDHIGMIWRGQALEALVAAIKRDSHGS